ncbi:hypothetical protein [Hoeflea sp.]|uniref:hypothetical protein n=1 Tax=Hoeflea sp. TaxID=1940281 RepID=UPI001997AE1E|nr:hypothetical protein [Hoeflea sp.]MBC7282607.1 hypothetical protein [Hoeflea sp.]
MTDHDPRFVRLLSQLEINREKRVKGDTLFLILSASFLVGTLAAAIASALGVL